jgi:hypothetical protein
MKLLKHTLIKTESILGCYDFKLVKWTDGYMVLDIHDGKITGITKFELCEALKEFEIFVEGTKKAFQNMGIIYQATEVKI